MIDLQSIASEVKPLILQAGDIIMNAWDEHHFTSQLKDERDIVTETDTEVENYLRKYLYKVLPQAGFIVEEGKTEMHSEYNWSIDPIDGTKYFANQIPFFFTQVSLLKGDEPVIAFVYNPISKQLFHAVKGAGTFCNEVKITKRIDGPLSSSILHFDLGAVSGTENAWKLTLFQKITQHCYRVRVTAGLLAPYLPLGGIDISINTDAKYPLSTKNVTDLAPHKLLLTEAGYAEERLIFEDHSFLVWASKELIADVKKLLLAN